MVWVVHQEQLDWVAARLGEDASADQHLEFAPRLLRDSFVHVSLEELVYAEFGGAVHQALEAGPPHLEPVDCSARTEGGADIPAAGQTRSPRALNLTGHPLDVDFGFAEIDYFVKSLGSTEDSCEAFSM